MAGPGVTNDCRWSTADLHCRDRWSERRLVGRCSPICRADFFSINSPTTVFPRGIGPADIHHINEPIPDGLLTITQAGPDKSRSSKMVVGNMFA